MAFFLTGTSTSDGATILVAAFALVALVACGAGICDLMRDEALVAVFGLLAIIDSAERADHVSNARISSRDWIY